MKTLTKILSITIMAASLAACGTSSNPNAASSLSSGYGGLNGYQTGVMGPGGCVPIQSGILTFSAQGIAMNGAVILAGNLPQNSPHPGGYGQVQMGGGMAGGIQYAPKQSSYGALQISVMPTNGAGTMSGQLQLSPQVISAIMGSMGSYGYQSQQSLCVQSIAFDIAHTVVQNQFNPYSYGNQYGSQYSQGTGQINQALVYLYLSNGQPIGPLQF